LGDGVFAPATGGLHLLTGEEHGAYDRRGGTTNAFGRVAVLNSEPIVPRLSIAVRAWNEEAVIRRTLESVFQQSLFEELSRRGEICEVICVPNGCTDRTAGIAADVFEEQIARHPFSAAFSCRVAEIQEAGRNNTWNAFVHEISNPGARSE